MTMLHLTPFLDMWKNLSSTNTYEVKNHFLVKWMGCPDKKTRNPKKISIRLLSKNITLTGRKKNTRSAPSLHCLVLPFHPSHCTISLTNISLMLCVRLYVKNLTFHFCVIFSKNRTIYENVNLVLFSSDQTDTDIQSYYNAQSSYTLFLSSLR